MALPVLTDDEASSTVRQLAELNPELSDVIEALGEKILRLPQVGLRNGLFGASKTYEIAFVRQVEPRGAFATFRAPSYRGKWLPQEQYGNRLTVEIRLRDAPPDCSGWSLRSRTFGGIDWSTGHVKNVLEMCLAFTCIREAYDSFDR